MQLIPSESIFGVSSKSFATRFESFLPQRSGRRMPLQNRPPVSISTSGGPTILLEAHAP